MSTDWGDAAGDDYGFIPLLIAAVPLVMSAASGISSAVKNKKANKQAQADQEAQMLMAQQQAMQQQAQAEAEAAAASRSRTMYIALGVAGVASAAGIAYFVMNRTRKNPYNVPVELIDLLGETDHPDTIKAFGSDIMKTIRGSSDPVTALEKSAAKTKNNEKAEAYLEAALALSRALD